MKQKTKKSAAKRFKITATGKVKFKRAGLQHILGFRSSKNKIKLRAGGYLTKADERVAKELLPYGK